MIVATAQLSAPATRSPSQRAPKISCIGTRSYLIEAPGDFDLAAQRRIWAYSKALANGEDFAELIPGMTNLLVVLKNTPSDPALVVQRLTDEWDCAGELDLVGKTIEIPTIYGGEHAIDLPALCGYSGLSAKEIVTLHAQPIYTVFSVGSAPGFGYLHGLDPRICMPRKSVPSLKMLKGMVTIGGMQTGVAVLTGPNGWNSIGFADITVFDPMAKSPAIMAPGDRVRFVPERIEL
ncbi:KipI family sensor histidine kinase inhibitor [Rhizobium tibeticum]|uniref:Sensor histidine kinase inhibitor, KipI family n=1 Tax=Rhizobium tibeticum TaxID=501024 RepID=A0A1H8RRR7_9HYPH|nr:5-oxoprolinase subunit PxpB [Rhizobium tibeticum]MDP9810752.1 KipI family sensor histidine kinase inhibitor [Rhizobium tibeticum]SEI08760.1 Sporulation inhibitor KipI [Rhizobium tibeticum]SEO68977.1 sensor histidine kinase inhibitor, KipI family [Rhizobium tibeticum]